MNPLERKEYNKRYYQLNKLKLQTPERKEYNRKWKKNPKYKKGQKEYFRKKFQLNKDYYRKIHREYIRLRPDKLRNYVRKRREDKRNAIGGHTTGDLERLKAQYNWTCPCCHRMEPEIKLTEDHIIPLSRGGSDNIENIQPLCGSCNSAKHTKIIKYQNL